ncbi:fimbrial biogenesis chaperone [Achromobacter pestifer]|uniref:Putative fimbrial chaperone YadV n=1 Tax=Achromobacter pestifer TaxID=1353889 RepID=A0A6S6YN18_9BURK|nr:molecular chaperone [Achromobacter pestifer]CAB3624934.1 putative fimbrial chaperone YadV [Achromobacter pestifer]
MAAAWADLAVTGTRFVYPEGEKRIVISLSNTGADPILVQTWLDHGGAEVDLSQLQVPFVLMPSLFRLDPGERKTLQLRYTGEPLPDDRETVLWINLRHAPSRQVSENKLEVVLSYVMKVLYRPAGLEGDAKDAPATVRWTYHERGAGDAPYLEAENPSPFSVSLPVLRLGGGRAPTELKGLTIMPKSTARFALPVGTIGPPASGEHLEFEAIDDLGLVMPGVTTLWVAPRS